jgi:hypothetical protein
MAPLRSLSLLLLCASSTWIPLTDPNSQEKPAAVKPVVVLDSCPVTKPGDRPFVPPSKYPKQLDKDHFWYGTDRLWVALPSSGTWAGLPHYTPQDPTFRQKIMWWREGLDADADLRGKFKITGKRLDSLAPPLLSDPVSGVSGGVIEHGTVKGPPFIMSGVNFPTLGCWEVIGHFEQDELTFVIWIAP